MMGPDNETEEETDEEKIRRILSIVRTIDPEADGPQDITGEDSLTFHQMLVMSAGLDPEEDLVYIGPDDDCHYRAKFREDVLKHREDLATADHFLTRTLVQESSLSASEIEEISASEKIETVRQGGRI